MLIGDLFENWDDRARNNAAANAAYKQAVYSQHATEDDQVFALLDKYYPQIVVAINKFNNGDRIYRGISVPNEALFVDPTKAVRQAANTENYTNMLVSDILPSWEGWPKRNRSLICSMHSSVARGYGENSYEKGPHAVLPLGDPVIGICPASDFWESFSGVHAVYPPELNSMLESLCRQLLKKKLTNTPDGLVADLAEMDKIIAANPDVRKGLIENWGTVLELVLSESTILQGLDSLLGPDANSFKLRNLSQLDAAGNDKEVWISAPALLVRATKVATWIDNKRKNTVI